MTIINTIDICDKCHNKMVYVLESTKNKNKEYYECYDCNYRVEIINTKMETRNRKTNIDTNEPIRKMVIPKFQDKFYLVNVKDKTSIFYNPISNIRRIESEIVENNQRNSLLSRITANKVGFSDESEI